MKLCLPRKLQSRRRRCIAERLLRQGCMHAGALGRSQLRAQCRNRIGCAREQVAVQPLEIALDVLVANDRLDGVGGSGKTLCDAARDIDTVGFFDGPIAIVRNRDVRSRATRFARTDAESLDDRDADALLGEQVRGREPGDTGSDDAHVYRDHASQRRIVRCLLGSLPKRPRNFRSWQCSSVDRVTNVIPLPHSRFPAMRCDFLHGPIGRARAAPPASAASTR